jgi:hypothetical protein
VCMVICRAARVRERRDYPINMAFRNNRVESSQSGSVVQTRRIFYSCLNSLCIINAPETMETQANDENA